MGKYHVPTWLQAALATSGGLGLFLLGFLDASFLPLPSLNDLVLIDLCIQFPDRMVYYAAMSTLGSVAGCVVLYYIGREGEELAFHAKAGTSAPRIRRWVERNGFLSMLVAAAMPPPMPLKIFVLGAGALGMPLRDFVLSVLLARALRFFAIGYLAVHYGNQTANFLMAHKVGFAVGSLAAIAGCYLIYLVINATMRQET